MAPEGVQNGSVGHAHSRKKTAPSGLTALAPVPSLDELTADPARAAGLPPEARHALTLRCLTVLAALAVLATNGHERAPAAAPEPDQLLTPAEAASALTVSVKWVYRHAPRLPFTRRLSGRTLRFSEAGLRRWQASRRS